MAVALVSGSLDHKIKFWDPASGLCVKTINFGDCQVNCLQISLDKRLLLAAGHTIMKLYDMYSSDENHVLFEYKHDAGNIVSVGFERDCKWIYSCGEDQTIRIWDTRSNACLKIFQTGAAVNCVCLDPNEQDILISGDQNGCVKLWSVSSLSLDRSTVPVTQALEEHNTLPDLPVRSIAISVGTNLVCVGSHRGRVFIYKLLPAMGGLQLLHDFVAHEEYLLHCAIDPRSANLATSSADRSIKIWDLSNVNILAKSTTEKKIQSINSSLSSTAAIAPISPSVGGSSSSSSAAGGGVSSTSSSNVASPVLARDLVSPGSPIPNSSSNSSTGGGGCSVVCVRTLSHHQRWVWNTVYSSESIFLVSASSDNTAKLWNVETGEVLRNLTGHTHAVTCVALNDQIYNR